MLIYGMDLFEIYFYDIEMPRKLRMHYPGARYHVMVRGNNKQNIFLDDQDRGVYCNIIKEQPEKFNIKIFSYCMMTNHVHFAIEVNDISLDNVMHNINLRYTKYFNKKRERIGHLYQARYKPLLIIEDRYLKNLIRYIHLNPVRSGLVKSPDQYFWSSHNYYLGKCELPWVSKEEGMSLFVPSNNEGYRKFMLSKSEQEGADFFENGWKGTDFIGSAEVVKTKLCSPLNCKITLKAIENYCCNYYKVPLGDFFKSKSHVVSKARMTVIAMAYQYKLFPKNFLARVYGLSRVTVVEGTLRYNEYDLKNHMSAFERTCVPGTKQ